MSRDPQLDQLDAVHSVLKSINASLAHLAAMTRLPLLYTSDEIKKLVQQYHALRDADTAAYQATQEALAALPEKGTSRDALVKLYGQEEVNRQYASFDQATKAKGATHEECMALSRKHPLIEQLVKGHCSN